MNAPADIAGKAGARRTAAAQATAMDGQPLPTRPRSAVSHGVGVAGLAGLFIWFLIARHFGMSGPMSALVNTVACGVPMVLWSLLVDKVHLNPTTGIDWSAPQRSWEESLEVSTTKLAGLWATWAIIAAIYAVIRFYHQGAYVFAMYVLGWSAVLLFPLSIPYVVVLDRYLKNPKDGSWAFGSWLLGNRQANRDAIADHARSWAVKGFYTAFMLAIVPGNFSALVATRATDMFASPVAFGVYLLNFMFLIDVAMAMPGYVLTMKPLDAHIRSATPLWAGWVSALICYEPFVLLGAGRVFDYHQGTAEWTHWLAGHPNLMNIWAVLLVLLTALYAWATVAFGIRFSNLTHRGILTHGPYALTKHPAYIAKNSFWWLATLPMFSLTSVTDAIRATALLGLTSAVYWWRAKTEERHLSSDKDYRAYAAWMRARHQRWWLVLTRRNAA